MAWTEEQKTLLNERYLAMDPTPANTTELIKSLAEEFEQTPNSVRMVLVQSNTYVKKDAAVSDKVTKVAKDGDAPKRVSKEVQMEALRAAIAATGCEADSEILSKITGKVAVYFTMVLNAK